VMFNGKAVKMFGVDGDVVLTQRDLRCKAEDISLRSKQPRAQARPKGLRDLPRNIPRLNATFL
jgi:hypothetical protein